MILQATIRESPVMEPWIQKRLDWLDEQKNPWEKVQDRDELALFLPWLKTQRPKSILEIGVRTASNFYLMAGCVCSPAVMVGLDINDKLHEYRDPVAEALAREWISVHYIVGDSTDLLKLIPDRKFDVIYIDGGHLYPQAKSDYEQSLKLLNPGGLIAFHDISPIVRTGEVDALWWELRDRRVFEEIHKIGRCGIGVLDPGIKE